MNPIRSNEIRNVQLAAHSIGGTTIVRRDETSYNQIARRLGVSAEALRNANPRTPEIRLQTGMEINVPEQHGNPHPRTVEVQRQSEEARRASNRTITTGGIRVGDTRIRPTYSPTTSGDYDGTPEGNASRRRTREQQTDNARPRDSRDMRAEERERLQVAEERERMVAVDQAINRNRNRRTDRQREQNATSAETDRILQQLRQSSTRRPSSTRSQNRNPTNSSHETNQ